VAVSKVSASCCLESSIDFRDLQLQLQQQQQHDRQDGLGLSLGVHNPKQRIILHPLSLQWSIASCSADSGEQDVHSAQ
jgi:hypothetical protein